MNTNTSDLIPVGTKVEIVGYNSFFSGLMGEVKESRKFPWSSTAYYVVSIENGEDFVHRYINLQNYSPTGCYVFSHEVLKTLPSGVDTTVKRLNAPTC